MKKTAFLLFLLSLFIIPPLWGQKSFSFRLDFTLTDKEGARVTPEDFWSGKVRLQASSFHREKFVYDDETGYFRYSESSLHPYAQLNFITDTDTTVVVLSEMAYHIENIPLSGNRYIFSSYFDREGNDIAYDYEINAYTLRQPLDYYKTGDAERTETKYIKQLPDVVLRHPYRTVEYKLHDRTRNADLDYKAIEDSLNVYTSGLPLLDSVFRTVPGEYDVYRFICHEKRAIFDFFGKQTDDYSLIILKLDGETIVDGYQYALSQPEVPRNCRLYRTYGHGTFRRSIDIEDLNFKRKEEHDGSPCDSVLLYLDERGELHFPY